MNGKILVVDDIPANIQLIASILDESGFSIEVATSGQDALASFDEAKYDMVLLDIMMPDMDGYETCRKIKELESAKDIPIIFLTAKTEPEDITKGFQAGGVDYITKPFNADELVSRVKTHLELKIHREKLEELVKERTSELNKANVELEKANEDLRKLENAKNEFINIISHEIRTPLNGILGPIQLMNMDGKGEVSTRMKILNESVERLELFAHKMILMSELRSGRYTTTKRNINLLPVLKDVLENLNDKIETKKLKIDFSEFSDLEIQSDAYLLNALLTNSIDNAINASKEGQLILINNETFSTGFRIKIVDEAGGIDDAFLESVFKPFTTGEKFVDKNMGVGLYLSKLIVDVLDGEFNIENSGKGVVATITF